EVTRMTTSAGVILNQGVDGGDVSTGEYNGRSPRIGQILRAATKFSPAHLCFIRYPSVLSGYGAPPIKVNDKPVGELAAGSYFVVQRPPGTYKITVQDFSKACETDVRFEPGMSHYFELGPVVRMNADEFVAASMGVTGRPVPCRSGGDSRLMFYSLDSAAGAAAIAKLKERKS